MAKVLTAIVHFTPKQVNEILTRVEELEAKKVTRQYYSKYDIFSKIF